MRPDTAAVEHEELRELLGLYALDALLPAERTMLREHLAGCPECQAELAALRFAVAQLPQMVDEMEPPPALRDRLEADVRADLAARSVTPPPPRTLPPAAPGAWTAPPPVVLPPRPGSEPPAGLPTPLRPVAPIRAVLPWAVATALLLAVSVGLLLWNLRLQASTDRPEDRIVAVVPGAAAPSVGGDVRLDATDGLIVLEVHDLPPLAAGEVYQVWLIGADETPVPYGVFDQPTARHAIAVDPTAYNTLAITTEPGPLGSPGPTSDIVATAPLNG